MNSPRWRRCRCRSMFCSCRRRRDATFRRHRCRLTSSSGADRADADGHAAGARWTGCAVPSRSRARRDVPTRERAPRWSRARDGGARRRGSTARVSTSGTDLQERKVKRSLLTSLRQLRTLPREKYEQCAYQAMLEALAYRVDKCLRDITPNVCT